LKPYTSPALLPNFTPIQFEMMEPFWLFWRGCPINKRISSNMGSVPDTIIVECVL